MVLIAGSANLDFVVRAAHIPAPGETVLGHSFQTFPGGKGANQAVACARAGGAATSMLLALGDDAFAAPLIESLTQAHVTLHTVRIAEQPTGTAFICVSAYGENAITVAPGANSCLTAAHLPTLAGVSHLLMQLETPVPTVLAYAQAAKAAGVQVVLNAAPAPAQALPAELLALVDILIVNEGELAAIVAAQNSKAAAQHNTAPDPIAPLGLQDQLAQLDVPCVVVTLGGAGCVARVKHAATGDTSSDTSSDTNSEASRGAGSHMMVQAAYKIDVVDTTAAGDTFCGVLVAALSQGSPMADALQTASAAAALACTKMGAQSSIPQQDAVKQFMLLA